MVWLIVSQSLGTVIQGSYVNAYVADLYDPRRRLVIYGALAAVGSLSSVAGIVGAQLSMTTLGVVSVSLCVIQAIVAAVFVKESLPPEQRTSLRCHGADNPFASIKRISHSKVAMTSLAITGLLVFSQVGMGDVVWFYLNQRINFGPSQIAIGGLEFGIMQPLALLLLLPLMSRYLSPVRIILIALAALMAQQIVTAVAWADWLVFWLVTPLYGLTLFAAPTTTTLLANTAAADDQGRRMAGIAAVVDLCEALGPLDFGLTYSNMHGPLVVLPFFYLGRVLHSCNGVDHVFCSGGSLKRIVVVPARGQVAAPPKNRKRDWSNNLS